jgi:hypothetical protein
MRAWRYLRSIDRLRLERRRVVELRSCADRLAPGADWQLHIGFFDVSLHHLDVRGRIGHDTGRGEVIVLAILLQLLRLGEACEGQRATNPFRPIVRALGHRDSPVGGDRDVVICLLEGDRAVVALHREAVGGHKLAGRVDLQGAVARVTRAVRRLHGEKCVAVDRDVERVTSTLDGALAHVAPGTAIDDVTELTVGKSRKVVLTRNRHQVFLENGLVGLEPVRVQIGDVVGDDVEFAGEYHLPR